MPGTHLPDGLCLGQRLALGRDRLGALLQLARDPLALGHVADRARHHQPALGLERAEADLDRKLGAVLAQSVEVMARTHRARLRIAHVVLLVLAMMLAEAVRDQVGDGLADQLLALVAEEVLGLGIDERDVAVPIDDHHRVWR